MSICCSAHCASKSPHAGCPGTEGIALDRFGLTRNRHALPQKNSGSAQPFQMGALRSALP
jgi:hypothetical protein